MAGGTVTVELLGSDGQTYSVEVESLHVSENGLWVSYVELDGHRVQVAQHQVVRIVRPPLAQRPAA